MPESNNLQPVRNHLVDADEHLRMALSALDPKGMAAGHEEYVDVESIACALPWPGLRRLTTSLGDSKTDVGYGLGAR